MYSAFARAEWKEQEAELLETNGKLTSKRERLQMGFEDMYAKAMMREREIAKLKSFSLSKSDSDLDAMLTLQDREMFRREVSDQNPFCYTSHISTDSLLYARSFPP